MEYENLPRGGPQTEGLGVEDRAVFERVWRRVMPEDRPDCPFVLEEPPEEKGEGGAQLPVPVQVAPVARTGATYQEEPDVPCLGAASAIYGAQLQAFIEGELADWKLYQALARRAGGSGSRTLSTIAADERRHAKRLSTAYFLISGVRYWPAERPAGPASRTPFAAALRERFMAEQRSAAAYQAAAAETADPCLRQLYEELSGEADAHAWLLRGILEEL